MSWEEGEGEKGGGRREGRRKREGGRGKEEEGRRKRKGARGKEEEERSKREGGRGKEQEGRRKVAVILKPTLLSNYTVVLHADHMHKAYL